MPVPSTIVPAKRRVLRKRHQVPVAAPAALVLTAVEYHESGWVRLTFGRAVDIAAMVVSTVVVDDGDQGYQFVGTGTPTLTEPATVQVPLANEGTTPVVDTRLTVAPGNGVAAADDGGTFAGVSNVVIPF